MSKTDPNQKRRLPLAGETAEGEARGAVSPGPHLWKSLEELAEGPAFPEFLAREYPRQAAELEVTTLSRRRLLELSLASMALGGLAACTRQPIERVVPYVKQPEGVVPGK